MAKVKRPVKPAPAHMNRSLSLDERTALWEREQEELRSRYSFAEAMLALQNDADPEPLIWHLRSGKPIPPEHAEQLSYLFDPKPDRLRVIATVQFRQKGMQERAAQRRAIYNAVVAARGGDRNAKMPVGAWDKIAARFGLTRKAVETAFEKARAEQDEYDARPDLDDEETVARLREEGWTVGDGD
jgi:hypothetical protein